VIERPIAIRLTYLACAPIARLTWDTLPKLCAWCAGIRTAPARDRLLRRTFHPGQLHDRGRRLAKLCHTKKMMYSSPAAWDELMASCVCVSQYAAEQSAFGRGRDPDLRQLGRMLSVDDYWYATCCR